MDVQTIELELQGQTWNLQIKPWPYKKGRRWLTRFVKILGALASRPGALEGAIGIDELLDRVPDTMLDSLIEECEGLTTCVGPDGKAVPFEKLSPLLVARYDVTLRLLVVHMKVTFGPFFASLGSVLADLTGGADEGTDGT